MAKPQIRPLAPGDRRLLDDFCYLAIHVPAGQPPLPKDVIYTEPGIRHYFEGFGSKPGDIGVAAWSGDQAVGMAWTRLLGGDDPGYGHLDDNTPELSMAVLPEWRGQGVGTRLIGSLLPAVAAAGYRQVSLSVQKDNPAIHLYQRAGFTTARLGDADLVMVVQLPIEIGRQPVGQA